MAWDSTPYRSPHTRDDRTSEPTADDATRRLVRQLADEHRGLPADVITRQVGEVRRALGWLGDDPEVNATLEKAIDHNLTQIESALASGASLSPRARGVEADQPRSPRTRRPDSG